MKLFEVSFITVMVRFYVMMGIIIVAGFTGLWWLSILALPVFFSALVGMKVKKKVTIQKVQSAESRPYTEQKTANL